MFIGEILRENFYDILLFNNVLKKKEKSKMGYGIRLKFKVEIFCWFFFKCIFNIYIVKMGFNIKSVLYRFDLLVFKD